MIFPQLFHILIQHMGREAAQLHPPHAADRPGGEGQPQQGGGGFGILAVQLKEVAHLIQDEAVRVGLPDLVQLIPPGGAGAFLLLGHGGLRYWRGGFSGRGGAGLRGRCGEQVKRNLPIIVLCHWGLHFPPQSAGRSRQLALRLRLTLLLGLADLSGLFRFLGLAFGLLGLLLCLLCLTLHFQLGLRQRFEQGVFAPPECLHIPQDGGHALVGFAVRGHSGQDIEHLLGQPAPRHGIVRPQSAENQLNGPVHIKFGNFCPVGVGLIEPIDSPSQRCSLIIWQALSFLFAEVVPAVDQRPDALLHLVPVQPDGGISFEAGFIILPGEFDPLAVMPLIIPGIGGTAVAVCLPQKLGALLGVVALHKIRINSEFSIRIAAAPQEQAVNFILGNKAGPAGDKALRRVKFLAGREQVYYINQ